MLTTQPILQQSDFQSFVDLQGNFPYTEKLLPKVLESQQYDLKPLLGTDFYEEIASVIENGNIIPGGFSKFDQTAYDALKVYLIDFVKYAAFTRYLSDPNNVLTRFGLVQKKTPHFEQSNGENRKESKRYYGGLSESAKADLCEYLNDNTNTFSTWGNDPSSSQGQGISFASS